MTVRRYGAGSRLQGTPLPRSGCGRVRVVAQQRLRGRDKTERVATERGRAARGVRAERADAVDKVAQRGDVGASGGPGPSEHAFRRVLGQPRLGKRRQVPLFPVEPFQDRAHVSEQPPGAAPERDQRGSGAR